MIYSYFIYIYLELVFILYMSFMIIGNITQLEEVKQHIKEALEEAGIHHATLEFEDERTTCCKECCED